MFLRKLFSKANFAHSTTRFFSHKRRTLTAKRHIVAFFWFMGLVRKDEMSLHFRQFINVLSVIDHLSCERFGTVLTNGAGEMELTALVSSVAMPFPSFG